MKIIDPNNQVQKEALLNEYKGNLFEFLVGLTLSRAYHLESNFYENLNQEYKQRLVMYEEFIREHFYDLIKNLSELSEKTVYVLIDYLQYHQIQLKQVHIIGKNVATNDNELWGETDIVLALEKNNSPSNLKISLKLSKEASDTNSKSAGVRSFLEKYFSLFKESEIDQTEFNQQCDFLFQNFGAKLYELEGLTFKGRFDKEWEDHYPSLPGELKEEQQKNLFHYYSEQARLLHEILLKYSQQNKKQFLKCLYPLMGMADKDLIQVITFHKDHHYKETKIIENSEENLDFNINPYRESSHLIEIVFKKKILQLRIKPMNKFTTQSYKVNCSVKEI